MFRKPQKREKFSLHYSLQYIYVVVIKKSDANEGGGVALMIVVLKLIMKVT